MSTSDLDKRRARRLQRDVPLGPLLEAFGYRIRADSPHEQQFSCDLHGGDDRKPSARYYPATNSTFCWACHKARGPLDYWVEKREVSFRAALLELESKYQLPPLSEVVLPEEEEEEAPEEKGGWEEACRTVEKALLTRTREGDGDMACILDAWEVFDRCLYLEHTGQITKEQGLDTIQALRVRLRSWRGCDMLSSSITPSNGTGL